MQWLKECLTNHATCNDNQDNSGWFPTRLLDLGDVGCEKVRLYHTAKESPSGPYCTLSHRWGGATFIQLNRNTAASLHSGFPLEQMPKTFREAVLTTKRLGVQYIWIDRYVSMHDSFDRHTYLVPAPPIVSALLKMMNLTGPVKRLRCTKCTPIHCATSRRAPRRIAVKGSTVNANHTPCIRPW
jgi:hypothetical protein